MWRKTTHQYKSGPFKLSGIEIH